MKVMLKKLLGLMLVVVILTSVTVGCNEDVDPGQNVSQQNNDSQNQNQNNKIEFTSLSEDSINTENIMNTIEELSSEKYAGRLPGTEGNDLAEKYIADYFKKIGLESPEGLDGYLQNFPQKVRIAENAPTLKVINSDGNIVKEYKYLEDFSPLTYNAICMLKGEAEGEVYEVKTSNELNSDNENLKGKIVLVGSNVIDEIGYSQFYSKLSSPQLGVKAVIIGSTVQASSASSVYSYRVAPHPQRSRSDRKLIFVKSDPGTYSDILSLSKEGHKVTISVDYSNKDVESSNIIGIIPGTDSELKDEYIIICGHMDHVGDNKNGTYNPGALDNASGTASVMEIARIMMENDVKPKKTIVFIAFNGEEEGLWGSHHYADYPLYPLDKTTVINLDMVGSKRIMPLEIANASKEESELRDTLYRYGKSLGLDCMKTTSQGSDHAPFGNKGVQAVLLIHLDRDSGYHTPGDTIETVDKDRINDVVKLVLYYLDKKAY